MESLSGLGLRIRSAGLASTSCMPGSWAKTGGPSRRRVTMPGSAVGRASRRTVVAGVQEISKLGGEKINGTKVEGAELGTIEAVVAAGAAAGAVLKVEREAAAILCEEAHPTFNAALVAMVTLMLAAEKQRRHEELAGKTEVPVDALRQGRLVDRGCVYRQTFVIRSYEVGANKTASIETLMNHFQEAALNHVWMSGLAGDGFGATHAMMRSNLIWVVTRMQVQVDRYPEWGEVVEIDTWVMASGKNGMRRDWLLRDYKTGQILARATSTWVTMNRVTRRLSKLPDEVRTEIAPYFFERSALLEKSVEKIIKLGHTASYVRSDLTPRRSDLDMNQHVNNVKYIGWILESLPAATAEDHEMTSMTLEYRRECGQSDVVQSMTSPESSSSSSAADDESSSSRSPLSYASANLTLTQERTSPTPSIGPVRYTHLLRLQGDGSELLRGRTVWRLK